MMVATKSRCRGRGEELGMSVASGTGWVLDLGLCASCTPAPADRRPQVACFSVPGNDRQTQLAVCTPVPSPSLHITMYSDSSVPGWVAAFPRLPCIWARSCLIILGKGM